MEQLNLDSYDAEKEEQREEETKMLAEALVEFTGVEVWERFFRGELNHID